MSESITTLSDWTIATAEDGTRVVTHELSRTHDLKRIVDVVGEVLRTKGLLWEIVVERGRPHIRATHLGTKFLICAKADFHEIDRRFSERRCNPLYTVFKRYAKHLWYGGDRLHLDQVDQFNRAVAQIRRLGKGPAVQRRLNNLRRCERANARSASGLLEALRTKHSKVMAIRLDLEYYSLYGPREGMHPQAITFKDAQVDRDAFLKYLRTGPFSQYLIGYIWKMEFGCEKGFHFHFAIFFDGQKVRQDIVIADALGAQWKEVTTRGKGFFFNCNKRKEAYVRCGVGTLSRSDDQMWDYLARAVRYLTKIDNFIRFQAPGKARTFGLTRFAKDRLGEDV